MALSDKQTRLAEEIDGWVKGIEQRGGGDAEILNEMSAHTRTFKQVLDLSSRDEFIMLGEQYAGFHRFGKVLEHLARNLQKSANKSRS